MTKQKEKQKEPKAGQPRKWLLWLGLLVLVLVLAYTAIEYKRNSPIEALVVQISETKEGLRFLDEGDLRDMLFNAFGHHLEGQVARRVNLQEVEQLLESIPYVKDAKVYMDTWNSVHIQIEQRQPLLRVMDILDEGYYLDGSGYKIPLSQKYTARVLVLTGEVGAYSENFLQVEDSRLRKVFELVHFIQEDDFLRKQIEQIHLDREGDALLVPKLGDHRIVFGAPDKDIADKFRRLEAFYRHGLSQEGWEAYRSLNLSYKGQLVAKRSL